MWKSICLNEGEANSSIIVLTCSSNTLLRCGLTEYTSSISLSLFRLGELVVYLTYLVNGARNVYYSAFIQNITARLSIFWKYIFQWDLKLFSLFYDSYLPFTLIQVDNVRLNRREMPIKLRFGYKKCRILKKRSMHTFINMERFCLHRHDTCMKHITANYVFYL